MGRCIHPAFLLGADLLSAAGQGHLTSGRCPSTRVQMDPYPLSALAGSNALRGIGLSQCFETPGFTTPSQLSTLIVKKLFKALDSLPQGVCSARDVRQYLLQQ